MERGLKLGPYDFVKSSLVTFNLEVFVERDKHMRLVKYCFIYDSDDNEYYLLLFVSYVLLFIYYYYFCYWVVH